MEYMKGRPVKKLIRRNGMIPEKMALAIALFTARGLQSAHERGIIHGNLKPSNLLVSREGVVKCCDTGLPRSSEIVVDEALIEELPQELTSAAVAYICPEIANGAGDLRPQADVYSLGMVLFHMLTGRPPFKGEVRQILEAVRRGEGPRFVTNDENASDESRALVMAMIAPDLRKRVKDMEIVIKQLRRIIQSRKKSPPRKPPETFDDDAPSVEGILLPPR
jgi:serine/threonine-protein kinase